MKERKQTQEKNNTNYSKILAIAGWLIISLAVSFGAGFFTAISSAASK